MYRARRGVYCALQLARCSVTEAFDAAQPLHVLLRLACEALQGIAYLHSVGIVHCDIKPANLLIADDGRLCVADLGAALSVHAPVQRHMRGTLLFLAPELFASEDGMRYTFATDMWAFGLTLESVYTSKPPYAHLSVDAR